MFRFCSKTGCARWLSFRAPTPLLQRRPATSLARPEHSVNEPGTLEQAWQWLRAYLTWPVTCRRLVMASRLSRIHRHARWFRALDDTHLTAQCLRLRQRLSSEGLTERLALQAFALVRETAWRVKGMAHHDVQLLGGLTMLHGHIAEMYTGEGKTLTATLPAATAALAGIPVHVITVNDYLASRDAESMAPIYQRLGLSVASIVHEMTPRQRREAYAADVVYCTNKELVFDYLRDSQLLKRLHHPLHAHAARLREALDENRLLLRGLHFAIVDEADSVMLDEARTPLILSARDPRDAIDIDLIDQALVLAGELNENEHFVREHDQLHLSDQGRDVVARQAERLGDGWVGKSRREWLIQQALIARHRFKRDHHYLVCEGKVQIVDEHTGRVMADRSWEKGLQQMIERLEGCEPSAPNVTLARLTYQRFFRRYHQLAGMTGTAREVRRELWRTYRRRVVCIPTHCPSRRRDLDVHQVASREDKWQWITERAHQLVTEKRAVLIATVSVADSEALSAVLMQAGLPHAVLNARQDAEEASVVAEAGRVGAITVATSMAGRGTDISLDAALRDAGGLHVIIAGRHDSARVDRQIAGRCARQGDPGSVEQVVAEDDALLEELKGWEAVAGSLSARLARAQRRREQRHARQRGRMLANDWREDELLGFSGQGE